jgi:hypothetical protein
MKSKKLREIYRQHGDFISLVSFFKIRKMPKKNAL